MLTEPLLDQFVKMPDRHGHVSLTAHCSGILDELPDFFHDLDMIALMSLKVILYSCDMWKALHNLLFMLAVLGYKIKKIIKKGWQPALTGSNFFPAAVSAIGLGQKLTAGITQVREKLLKPHMLAFYEHAIRR